MVFRMRCDHQSNPLGKNARDRRVGAFIQCEHPPRSHVPFSDRSFRYRVNRVHIFHGALTGIRGPPNRDIHRRGTLPVCASCMRAATMLPVAAHMGQAKVRIKSGLIPLRVSSSGKEDHMGAGQGLFDLSIFLVP